MERRDPRAVLGLPEDADLGQARRAFRQLAKRTHPDAGGDGPTFAEIADAFAALRAQLPPAPITSTPTAPARRPSPFDWILQPGPPVTVLASHRRAATSPAPVRDFAAVLAAEVARLAA